MKETSRLVSIELVNFMGYSYTRIDFDETNIISLKGYNSAGKTTVIRALAVINSDAWAMKQSKFIKYGASKFEIIENFSDGVRIVKEKYISGKSSYTMYKDGEEIFSTIQNGVYTSVKGVPDYVARYLNLIDDTKLNLHIRRGRDDLLLVDTSGRENYEFLSSALKAEEVTTASGMLKTDRLEVKSEISAIEYEIDSYTSLVQKDKVVTVSLVEYLEEHDRILAESESKKLQLENMFKLIEDYGKIKPSIHLNKIGVSKVALLGSIFKKIEDYNNVRVSVPLNKTDHERVARLLTIFNGIEQSNKYQTTLALDKVNFEKLNDVTSILKNLEQLQNIEATVKKNKETLEEYNQAVVKMEQWLKENKVQTVRCRSCGELQPVGESHIH